MFGKFSRSWGLVKASASVLRADKELMLFPILSSIATLLVLATFALPVFALKLFANGFNVFGALLGFVFYFCQYSVIVFFNSALVAAATIRLEGGDPTFSDGIRAAKARLPAILGYAAIAATVGVLLQSLKNRDNNVIVRLIGSGLGMAWTLATFLVVPVLVNRNVGPIDALKESVALLKKTWGENAIGNVGIGAAFGLITMLVVLAGIIATLLAWQISAGAGIAVAALFLVCVLVLGVIQAALSGIYSAVLYRYAVSHEAPAEFRGLALESAFASK